MQELVRRVFTPAREVAEVERARLAVRVDLAKATDRLDGTYILAHRRVVHTVLLNRHIISRLEPDQPYLEAELRDIQRDAGMVAGLIQMAFGAKS